jgi:hypothetical protein
MCQKETIKNFKGMASESQEAAVQCCKLPMVKKQSDEGAALCAARVHLPC